MVQDTGLSGVELLALYGDDGEEIGAFHIPAMRTLAKVGKKAIKFTPQYWMYKGAKAGIKAGTRKAKSMKKRISGDDSRVGFEHDAFPSDVFYPQSLGAAKKTTAKKKGGFITAVRKVGKVTSGFTSAAAQAVGVPKPLLTAVSKLDPTKKKPSATAAVKALTPAAVPEKMIVPVESSAMKIDPKKIAIIGGAAIGSLVILRVLTAQRH